LLEELGCRELRTNSGDSSFETCVRKRERQGATLMLDGFVAVVDIVQETVAGEAAMVNDVLN
jgi:hypothetical protein